MTEHVFRNVTSRSNLDALHDPPTQFVSDAVCWCGVVCMSAVHDNAEDAAIEAAQKLTEHIAANTPEENP